MKINHPFLDYGIYKSLTGNHYNDNYNNNNDGDYGCGCLFIIVFLIVALCSLYNWLRDIGLNPHKAWMIFLTIICSTIFIVCLISYIVCSHREKKGQSSDPTDLNYFVLGSGIAVSTLLGKLIPSSVSDIILILIIVGVIVLIIYAIYARMNKYYKEMHRAKILPNAYYDKAINRIIKHSNGFFFVSKPGGKYTTFYTPTQFKNWESKQKSLSMKFCRYCGYAIPKDSMFCPKCDRKQEN